MLKTQDANNDPQPAASREAVSQARVTPQELTEALAAIESRKQAEASRLAGTIPIGDAIADLHLDSTPEDIWAEVQAQRAKADAAQVRSADADTTRRARRPQAKAAEQARQQSVTPRRSWRKRGAIGIVLVGWLVFHNAFSSHSGGHVPSHVAAPILRPLAEIPNDKEVFADDAALVQVSQGQSWAQITVSENASGNRWTLVKIGGHVYLRGYIESADSLQPLQGKPLNVYNDDNSGELHDDRTSNITLRVDNVPLQKSGGDSDFSGITVTHFQPDPLTTLSPWH